MYKVFLVLFLSFILAEARDNPFFPSSDEQDIPLSSNLQESETPLKRATITLPSTARTVEYVTIKYKNLDGSLEDKTIELKNSIDWHLPLFVSQNYNESESTIKEDIKKKNKIYKPLLTLAFVQFSVMEKELKMTTKDKIIRDFLLVKPHRIVVDLKRDIDIRSYEKDIQKSEFSKIKIGNHKGYYRVVIELDGYYRYKLEQVEDGYIFKLL